MPLKTTIMTLPYTYLERYGYDLDDLGLLIMTLY
jgi:hypothetical protein